MRKRHSDTANGARVTISIVVLCAMCIVGTAAFSKFYFTPERSAMEQLDFLSKAYYEEYFYDMFTQTVMGSAEDNFSKFSEHGLAPVYLRQFLSFSDGKYSNYRSYFEGYCDTNTTMVYYYPRAPYGKTDYEIKYVHSCNF